MKKSSLAYYDWYELLLFCSCVCARVLVRVCVCETERENSLLCANCNALLVHFFFVKKKKTKKRFIIAIIPTCPTDRI